MIRKVGIAVGVVAVVVLIAGVVVLRSANAGPYSLTPLPRWAISSAFDGKTNPLQNPKLEIECKGFDCEEVLPHLPAVTRVECFEDLGPVGACCHVFFGDEKRSEVHVWWEGIGKYRISLIPPQCPDPDSDSTVDAGSSGSKQWIRCDEV